MLTSIDKDQSFPVSSRGNATTNDEDKDEDVENQVRRLRRTKENVLELTPEEAREVIRIAKLKKVPRHGEPSNPICESSRQKLL